ncbi:MAG: aldo/keto reductase [Deltaproteobacteria bacterium]|nr:aldo/keto reductase [Deltaproteobacteria bacterium]
MEYRKFGNTDFNGSILGFGAMRLPVTDNRNRATIDEPLAGKMIACAIEQGVNYIDTAYFYHEGESERFVGRVLKDGYRNKVALATKMPVRLPKSHDDCNRILDEQLGRLQTDRIDYYLLHGLNHETWPNIRKIDIFTWAQRAIADGRIRHFGFSFHDDFPTLKEIIDAYDQWTVCQIQYNYMDTEYQATTEGLNYAAQKGLSVVVMEPIRGGHLAKEPPARVKDIFAEAPKPRSPAEWALQWVWDQPGVSMVLSGMTAMEHVVENCALAKRASENTLSAVELKLIARAKEAYRELCPIPCTNCRYCMPCTNNIRINRIFELYNDVHMYNDTRVPRMRYGQINPEQRGDQCIECGTCEDSCPQNIPIQEWLKKADELLAPKKASNK